MDNLTLFSEKEERVFQSLGNQNKRELLMMQKNVQTLSLKIKITAESYGRILLSLRGLLKALNHEIKTDAFELLGKVNV